MTTPPIRPYRPRDNVTVLAVRLDLDLECFTYRKWGNVQRARPGDWLVNNGGEVYTVSGSSFARCYEQVSPAEYRKVATVWAYVADSEGVVPSEEGATEYRIGDYVVFHSQGDTLGWATSAEEFLRMYEPG